MTLPSLIQWLETGRNGPVEAILLDIDGVLISGGHRLPGSRTLLDLIGRLELPCLLLTNDGNHSTREKASRLQAAGLDVQPAQIVSCGHAIAPLVQKNRWTGHRFFIMGDTGQPCYAQSAGLETTRDLNELSECFGVIIGEENYAWEPVINAVINFFIDHLEAPLIVPNPDAFYPGKALRIHVAAGGVAAFIRQILQIYGRELEPLYLGKPHGPIFHMARERLAGKTGRPIAFDSMLMVGDNLFADIVGGKQVGCRTALILTGVTAPERLESSQIVPDWVFSRL